MSMSPMDLLRILFSGIPASDHIVSVNDVRKGPVTSANARLDGGIAKFDYQFQMDGSQVTVQGESPLHVVGRPGGPDRIVVNGREVEGDDIVIGYRIVTSGLAIVITFKFMTEDGPRKIRIDAKKRWL